VKCILWNIERITERINFYTFCILGKESKFMSYDTCIGLSGKFVPILKENWNAEDLNFSIHLLNYIG